VKTCTAKGCRWFEVEEEMGRSLKKFIERDHGLNLEEDQWTKS